VSRAGERGSRAGRTLIGAVPLVLGLAASAPQLSNAARPEPASATSTKVAHYGAARRRSTVGGLEHCPLGNPVRDTIARSFGPTRVLVRESYSLEHSAHDKIPLWVCEHLSRADVTGSLGRPKPEPFAPDPDLAVGERAELKDYRGSGFDRGHQAPSADQTRVPRAQVETYYLSNMAPQAPKLNQQIWKALEDQVRKWVIERGELYVVTGPLFYDPKEESPTTANGLVPHAVIGPDEVAVPTHFFKVVVAPPRDGHGWEAQAFVMENRGYVRPFDLSASLVRLSWLEERTGLTILPQLPRADEAIKMADPVLWK